MAASSVANLSSCRELTRPRHTQKTQLWTCPTPTGLLPPPQIGVQCSEWRKENAELGGVSISDTAADRASVEIQKLMNLLCLIEFGFQITVVLLLLKQIFFSFFSNPFSLHQPYCCQWLQAPSHGNISRWPKISTLQGPAKMLPEIKIRP
jgi:hypothetical protein